MKWRDARNSHLEQAYSSVPKVNTDVKSLNSLKAGPATKVKNSLSVEGKMKKIVVGLSTSSRCVVVTRLETGAFMAIVAYVDKLMVKGCPA